MKVKTHFIPRVLNFVNPKICIYDLDGTIIDSSHRAKYSDEGILDLEHWKENSTKENIFRDELLPLYWQLRSDYENGNIVGVVIAQLNKLKVAKTIGSLPENVNFGIKASTVRQFLTAAGLPTKWSDRKKKKSRKEVAQIAKKQTVMVMCHK